MRKDRTAVMQPSNKFLRQYYLDQVQHKCAWVSSQPANH